jgi:hypothetical protein
MNEQVRDAIKVMEPVLGHYMFAAVNQHGVLQLTFARKTISLPRLKFLAGRRARAAEHTDQGSTDQEGTA